MKIVSRLRQETVRDFGHFISILQNDNTQDTVLFRGQREDRDPIPSLGRLQLDRDVLAAEAQMLNDFKLQSRALLEVPPQDDFEWLALAQHYGMPTRLLDWSPNPLAALWFAVNRPATGTMPGAVWVFKPRTRDFLSSKDTSPFTCRNVRVYRPGCIAGRIRAQVGYLTVHPFDSARQRFVMAHEGRNPAHFIKLLLPHVSFPDIRYRLDQLGVNRATLFPDLDGLCGHIAWLHSRLGDEDRLDRDTKLGTWKI